MFIREKVKTLAALGSVTAGVWMLASVSALDQAEQCHQKVTSVANAEHVESECGSQMQISWRAWASGKSLSFQFHFFDLLELLYGGESDSRFSGQGN